MTTVPAPQRDPLGWTLLIALAFLGLCLHRLGIPTKIYFDETHYVPAARKLLALTRANPEHPMLSKEAIAAAIALLIIGVNLLSDGMRRIFRYEGQI